MNYNLNEILNSFPKENLSSYKPSPIQRLYNVEKYLKTKVKIYIKRDDLLRPYFGNKIRYIEYILGHYHQTNSDCIIHAGGITSNYMGQLAMAGAIKNIPIHIVLEKKPEQLQGNTLIEKLFGAKLHFVSRSTDTNTAVKEKVKNELIEKGFNPYVIDYPHANYLAYLGYMDAYNEIITQRDNESMDGLEHIYLCSGHHSFMGLKFAQSILHENINIVGVKASHWKNFAYFKSFEHFIDEKIREFSEFLKIKFDINDVNFTEDFVGKEYAIPSDESLRAMHIMAKYEGIILDPIYSAKAFAGLIEHIKIGKIKDDESVLFIHTGGIFNVFQYNNEIENFKSERI